LAISTPGWHLPFQGVIQASLDSAAAASRKTPDQPSEMNQVELTAFA
jgi:hypothetical protein